MSGATSVSGMRTPGGGSRRGHDTARIDKGISGSSITVHIIILGLAVLLWWIARDMVAVNRQLPNAGRVRFELHDELKGKWRVFSNSTAAVSLDVSGPTKEINDFAASLDQHANRFTYTYTITPADLANLPENPRRQVTLNVETRRFETTEAVAPPELTIRPLGTGGDGSGGTFMVVLERYIERPAYVDLAQSARGQIQETFTREDGRSETRAFSYTAEVQTEKEIRMFGPASIVEAGSDPNGIGRLKVTIDARQALNNFAKAQGLTTEQVLQRGTFVSTVQIPPVEGVSLKDSQGADVAFVNVRIDFEQKQDYVPRSGNFPVDVVLPNWLSRAGAHVVDVPATIPVDMLVLSSQADAFNQKNVRVRLDLSDVDENDVQVEDLGGGKRRVVLTDQVYSLKINTDMITYKFANDKVTAEHYQDVLGEVQIEWVEE